MTLNEMRGKRTHLLREARVLVDKATHDHRDLTSTEATAVDAAIREADLLTRQIEAFQPDDDSWQSRGTRPYVGRAEREYQPGEVRLLSREERFADLPATVDHDIRPDEVRFGRWLKGITTGNWQGATQERAMATGIDTLGGFVVPELFSGQIIDMARAKSRVFEAGATSFEMESGTVKLAKVTAGPTVQWKAENALATESDISLGLVELNAKTLIGIVRCSVELIEDATNIDALVKNELSAAIGAEMDRAMLYGAGGSEPLGVRNYPGVGNVAAGGVISYADFSEAAQDIAAANGPTERLAAILSPRDAGLLDRLVDSTGQPLNAPASFQAMRKLTTNRVLTTLGAGTESEVYVGAWADMLIGIRRNLVIEVSREADDAFHRLQVLIRAYTRLDMVLQHPEFFSVITGTTAS